MDHLKVSPLDSVIPLRSYLEHPPPPTQLKRLVILIFYDYLLGFISTLHIPLPIGRGLVQVLNICSHSTFMTGLAL